MLKIIIPTKGRVKQQLTLQNLPPELQAQTVLVCPEIEVSSLKTEFRFWMRQPTGTAIWAQPAEIKTIAQKRHWILKACNDLGWTKIVMLDDDLRFAVRREDDPGLFRAAVNQDIIDAFMQLESVLGSDTPHAGFSARGGGISDTAKQGGWQAGKRMMYVLGYHVPTVLQEAIHGRISTHEDMDVCLQLLVKGFPNSVNFSFVVDQKFGNKGGCTDERTLEQNNADSYQLALWFPDYVKAKEKEYKGQANRVEVVCQWVKAMKDGIRNRQQRQSS